MAKKDEAAIEQVRERKAAEPSRYTAKEIARNAPALFGYSVDIAAAALETAKIGMATIDEAKSIIKAFAERKVN